MKNGTHLDQHWITVGPIRDDDDYYRDDEDFVRECLNPPIAHNKPIMCVLGARRFGKTSFLRRLERWACKEEFGWDSVYFLDMQHSPAIIGKEIAKFHDEMDTQDLPGTAKSSTHKILVLIDEFNNIHGDKSRSQHVESLLSRVRRNDLNRCAVRIVIAEATNIYDELRKSCCMLSPDVRRELEKIQAMYMRGLEKDEIEGLITHRKRLQGGHAAPEIKDERLWEYAGNHPLFLQYICHAYFARGVDNYEDFRDDYAPTFGIKENQELIYRDLSEKEKIVLRFLFCRDAEEKDFLHAGHNILMNLRAIGLVSGYKIGSQFLAQHMKRIEVEDPARDSSPSVLGSWHDLFSSNHSLDEKPRCIIHQIGNLHIPASLVNAESEDEERGYLGSTWKAYLRQLREDPDRPHLLVVAGDLVLNDLDEDEWKDLQGFGVFDWLEEEFRALVKENRLTPIDAGPERIIPVPGDTDGIVRILRKEKDYLDLDFSPFNKTFRNWESWKFYQDQRILIAPFNSADITPALRDPRGAPLDKRLHFLQLARKREDDLFQAYREAQLDDFGCLSVDLATSGHKAGTHRPKRLADPDSLKKKIEQELGRLRKKHKRHQEIFDHALRIAVFHHHLEQMSESQSVDFWRSHEVKEILAEHRFSIILNAHSLRPFIHSDTIYGKPAANDENASSGELSTSEWFLHSIGCGSMSAEFDRRSSGINPSYNKIEISVRYEREGIHQHVFSISVETVNLETSGERVLHRFEVRR